MGRSEDFFFFLVVVLEIEKKKKLAGFSRVGQVTANKQFFFYALVGHLEYRTIFN